jgi:hypothetical protein
MLNHFVLSLISVSLVAQTTSSVPPKKTGIPNRPEKLSFRSEKRELNLQMDQAVISCLILPVNLLLISTLP